MTHIDLSAITVDPKFAGMEIRKDAIFFGERDPLYGGVAYHCTLAGVSIYGYYDPAELEHECKSWEIHGVPTLEGIYFPSLQHATEAALKAMGAW